MDHLYSLYDALVSINVPNDRARAVVDAMERDMFEKLATKADLVHTRELISRDMQAFQTDMEHSFEKLESRLTIKFGSMMAGGVVLLGVLQQLL